MSSPFYFLNLFFFFLNFQLLFTANTSSGGPLLRLFYRPGIQSLGFTVESRCVLHHPSLLDEANISVINPGTIISCSQEQAARWPSEECLSSLSPMKHAGILIIYPILLCQFYFSPRTSLHPKSKALNYWHFINTSYSFILLGFCNSIFFADNALPLKIPYVANSYHFTTKNCFNSNFFCYTFLDYLGDFPPIFSLCFYKNTVLCLFYHYSLTDYGH